MAIPKSTFVMGALVLGLFGLAIRETAAKKDATHERDGDDDEEYGDDEDSRESMAAYEADEARRAAERRAEEAEEAAKLDKLVVATRAVYGAEAASMGPLFTGVTLDGSKAELPSAAEFALRGFRDTTESEVVLGDVIGQGPIYAVVINPHASGESDRREQLCDKLGASLRDAWGSGVTNTSGETTIWLNPSTMQRATFQGGRNCELRFEHYVLPTKWLDRSPTSLIPLSYLGQSAVMVARTVDSTIDDGTIHWIRPGVGAGTSPTHLIATAVKGKIVSITASTTGNASTLQALEEHLQTTFGKPKRTDNSYNVELAYPSKPAIELDEGDDDRLFIVVGKLP